MISRRGFLVGVGAATTGLALGIDRLAAAAGAAAGATSLSPSPIVQLGSDGTLTIIVAHTEMGQGIRSTVPVLVADEVGASMARVAVVTGDGDKRYGDQGTGGSSTISGGYEELRRIGATLRTMLIEAAAQTWKVPAAGLRAEDHAVHDGKRSLGFGELVAVAATLPVPTGKAVTLRPRAELRHVGTELPLLDAPAFVSGKAQFGADVIRPGMKMAVVARPPAFGGTVASFDQAPALAVPGVRQVVQLPDVKSPPGYQPLGGVAVIADNTWAAMRGRAALKVTWNDGPNADHDSASYRAQLAAAVAVPGEVVRKTGDVIGALAKAAKVVEAEYHVPHLVHQPIEPPVALAEVRGDKVELWLPTQDPQAVQAEVGAALKIKPEDVTVHVTFLGGSFGRKSKPDHGVEAALLSRAAGAPVRVQWTRTDELRHGYYHAASVQRLAAGLDASGEVIAWRHRTAFPSISSTFAPGKTRPSADELSMGATDLPLAIPNVQVEAGEARPRVRIGWLRSVCNIQHAFATQSFIAELAHATGRDPRDMLLKVIGKDRHLTPEEAGTKLGNYDAKLDVHPIDTARLRRVIEQVTEAAGWDRAKASGRALGLAAHRSFLSYTACVVEVVKAPGGGIRIAEIWMAADCGLVVNPDRARAQLEGSAVFGMTTALHGGITMKAGVVEQANFHDARLTRIGEVPPRINVRLVPSEAPPGGVGEPGFPPVAPAICNAVFALTGTRVRDLPLAGKLG